LVLVNYCARYWRVLWRFYGFDSYEQTVPHSSIPHSSTSLDSTFLGASVRRLLLWCCPALLRSSPLPACAIHPRPRGGVGRTGPEGGGGGAREGRKEIVLANTYTSQTASSAATEAAASLAATEAARTLSCDIVCSNRVQRSLFLPAIVRAGATSLLGQPC
jgi:hypothetical protein